MQRPTQRQSFRTERQRSHLRSTKVNFGISPKPTTFCNHSNSDCVFVYIYVFKWYILSSHLLPFCSPHRIAIMYDDFSDNSSTTFYTAVIYLSTTAYQLSLPWYLLYATTPGRLRSCVMHKYARSVDLRLEKYNTIILLYIRILLYFQSYSSSCWRIIEEKSQLRTFLVIINMFNIHKLSKTFLF